MTVRTLTLAITLAVWPASAQLPPSGPLSDSDWPLVRAVVARIDKLLRSAPDKATVTYEMALTWASAKQWPETMDWLRKVVELKAGLDPSRDSRFAEMRGTREFDAILAAVVEATPPVSHSSQASSFAKAIWYPRALPTIPGANTFIWGA